jgi:hypothetical protein
MMVIGTTFSMVSPSINTTCMGTLDMNRLTEPATQGLLLGN